MKSWLKTSDYLNPDKYYAEVDQAILEFIKRDGRNPIAMATFLKLAGAENISVKAEIEIPKEQREKMEKSQAPYAEYEAFVKLAELGVRVHGQTLYLPAGAGRAEKALEAARVFFGKDVRATERGDRIIIDNLRPASSDVLYSSGLLLETAQVRDGTVYLKPDMTEKPLKWNLKNLFGDAGSYDRGVLRFDAGRYTARELKFQDGNKIVAEHKGKVAEAAKELIGRVLIDRADFERAGLQKPLADVEADEEAENDELKDTVKDELGRFGGDAGKKLLKDFQKKPRR